MRPLHWPKAKQMPWPADIPRTESHVKAPPPPPPLAADMAMRFSNLSTMPGCPPIISPPPQTATRFSNLSTMPCQLEGNDAGEDPLHEAGPGYGSDGTGSTDPGDWTQNQRTRTWWSRRTSEPMGNWEESFQGADEVGDPISNLSTMPWPPMPSGVAQTQTAASPARMQKAAPPLAETPPVETHWMEPQSERASPARMNVDLTMIQKAPPPSSWVPSPAGLPAEGCLMSVMMNLRSMRTRSKQSKVDTPWASPT